MRDIIKKIQSPILIMFFAVFCVSGCGGGGAGGEDVDINSTLINNSATSFISADLTKVFLGNSIEVSWNSTNASLCKASGYWSGDKPASGSEAFAMTTPGDQVFTISCGTVSSSVTVAVSSQDFEGSCINPHSAKIKESYIGAYQLPTPDNQFADDHLKAVGLKDYGVEWIYSNYKGAGVDWIADCTETEYVKLMYRTTLRQLKEHGVETVWVYNFGYWQNYQAESWRINHDRKHLSDWVIEYIAETAQDLGMRMHYAWQFLALDDQNNLLFPFDGQAYVDRPLLTKIMNAHEEHILWEANRLQQLGGASISADWSAMWLCFCGLENDADQSTRDELRSYYMERMGSIVSQIKDRFDGEVYVGEGVLWNDSRVFEQVDGIIGSLPGNLLQEDEVENATVGLIEARVADYIGQLNASWTCNTQQPCWPYTTYQQPDVIWNLFAQSHTAFLHKGWIEDGFCTAGEYEGVRYDECLQDYVPADFSAQAIFIEGMLRAIDKQSWFETKGTTASTAYWLSDTIIPEDEQYSRTVEGFPNISQSIRGKPAEKILKYWYSGEYEVYSPVFID